MRPARNKFQSTPNSDLLGVATVAIVFCVMLFKCKATGRYNPMNLQVCGNQSTTATNDWQQFLEKRAPRKVFHLNANPAVIIVEDFCQFITIIISVL